MSRESSTNISVRGVRRIEKSSSVQEGVVHTANSEKASIKLIECCKIIQVKRSLFDLEKGKDLQPGQKVFVYFEEDTGNVCNVSVPKAFEDSFSMSVSANRGDPEDEFDFDAGNFTGFLKSSAKPRQIGGFEDYGGLGLSKPGIQARVERPQAQAISAAAEDDEYPQTISKARLSIEKMREIYPNSKVYLRSVEFVGMRFDGWRKSRGDGNCYYRALGAAYIEHLARQTTGIDEIETFIAKLEQNEGYFSQKPGFNDNRRSFLESLRHLRESKANNSVAAMIQAQSLLLSQSFDDNLIKELRVLTANSLILNKAHPDIEPYAGEMLDYYLGNILKMGEDAEGLAFLCMAEALKIVIQHITIDKDTGVRSDYFRPLESGRWPKMFVWLRPGHYDMIYSKEQMYTDGYSFEKRVYRPPELTNSDRVTLKEQLYEDVVVAPPPDPRVKLPEEFIEQILGHVGDLYDSLQRAREVDWIINYATSFTTFKEGLKQHLPSLMQTLPEDCLERLLLIDKRLTDTEFMTKVSGLCRLCKEAKASMQLACGHRYCKPDLLKYVSSITSDLVLLAPHEQPSKPLACPLCDYRLTSNDLEKLLGDLYQAYSRDCQVRTKEYELRAMQERGLRMCKHCGIWKEEASCYLKANYCKHACTDCVRRLKDKGENACKVDGNPWPELPYRSKIVERKELDRQSEESQLKSAAQPKARQIAQAVSKPDAKIKAKPAILLRDDPVVREIRRAEPARPQAVKAEPKAQSPHASIKNALSKVPKQGESQKKCEGCELFFAISQFPTVFCKQHAICQSCYLITSEGPKIACPICEDQFEASLVLGASPLKECSICSSSFQPYSGVACGCTCSKCRDEFECAFCVADFSPPISPDLPEANEVYHEVENEYREEVKGKGSCSFCHEEVMASSMKAFKCEHKFCKSCAACIEVMQSQNKDCPLCERHSARVSARPSLRRMLVGQEPPRNFTRQCPICMSQVHLDNIRTLDCDHVFCTDCLTQHITWKIKNNDLAEGLKCPNCPSNIEGPIVQDLIDDDMFFKFNYFSIKRMYNVINCVMCKMEFVLPPGQRNAKCPTCEYSFCSECIEKAHKGSCQDAMIEKALRDLEVTGETVAQCPGCFHPYLKDEECDHVKCVNPKCMSEFCFECSCYRSPTLHHGNHYHRPDCKHYFKPGSDPDHYNDECSECKRIGKLCKAPIQLQEARRFQKEEQH